MGKDGVLAMREIKFRAWDKENEIYLYNVQNAHDTVLGDAWRYGWKAEVGKE